MKRILVLNGSPKRDKIFLRDLYNFVIIDLRELNMKKYIAYCGLDCENCDARLATINDDAALRQRVAKHFARSVSVRWTGMWRPAAAAVT